MGKGSTRRPTDQAKFESNFDEIDWGKGKKPKKKPKPKKSSKKKY